MWRIWQSLVRRFRGSLAVPEPVPPTSRQGELYLVVYVYPKVEAKPNDLIALGKALQVWMLRRQFEISGIGGLDRLLAGLFPPMEVYIGCLNEQTLAAPKWETCPAILCSPNVHIKNDLVVESLRKELPQDLYSRLTWPPMD
jgi:hypothetical protein